jgi:hypothetical protein
MACTALTIISIVVAVFALYMLRSTAESYVTVYQAPIVESRQLFNDFVVSTEGEDLVEPFQINYAAASKVGVSGYVPGYDSMNQAAGWNPNSDLEAAARYGDLNVIGALATGGGYVTKNMNV